jgi:hypothetical protein
MLRGVAKGRAIMTDATKSSEPKSSEPKPKAEPALSEGHKREFVAAYTAAYTKARQALPQIPVPPQPPGVPVGQGYRLGTDAEIAARLVEHAVTTREEAEALGEETAQQDAGVAPATPATPAEDTPAPASPVGRGLTRERERPGG